MKFLLLTSQQQEEIYLTVRRCFIDVKSFDLIAPSIKMLIFDSTKVDIDPLFLLSLEERYLSHQPQLQLILHQSASKEQRLLLQQLKIILTTTVIYLYSFHSFIKNHLYSSFDELLQHYPSFKTDLQQQYCKAEERMQELQYLLYFRNFMVIALMLIPAKGNKTFLLRVVERLEGSGRGEYIMGTGQKPTVTRRLTIFHQESRIPFSKKTGKKQREKQYELSLKMMTTNNYNFNHSSPSLCSGNGYASAALEEKENSSWMEESISYQQQQQQCRGLKRRSRSGSRSPGLDTPQPLIRKHSYSSQNQSNSCFHNNHSSNNNYNSDCGVPVMEEMESTLSWENQGGMVMSEETRNLLLDEGYTGSFTEELYEMLMDEDQ